MGNFWEKLKPAPKVPAVTAVNLLQGGTAVTFQWDDGKTTLVSARVLRQTCPCAECVDEWTSKRTFDPARIPEGIGVLNVQTVGNYALAFEFSDKHSTGIFTWAHLREATEKKPAAEPSPS